MKLLPISLPASRSRRGAAFTLIELLTVIAIIAILMGILFPVIAAVKEGARRTQAKNDVQQIVAAVNHYYTEYGKYPSLEVKSTAATADAATQDVFVGEKSDDATPKGNNSLLFYTLRGIPKAPNDEHRLNPRKIEFFQAKSVKNPEAPSGGFLDKEVGGSKGDSKVGCFFDPWGKQYFVMIDSNYDKVLDMGQCYTDFSATDDRPRVSVGVFSMGKDETLGDLKSSKGVYRSGQKVSDDIISWE